jgi:hypothetical protein
LSEAPPSPRDAFEAVYDKFDQQTPPGDVYFFVRDWSAWIVSPKTRKVAPIVRLSIGDQNGNVILTRAVTFHGLMDLVEELAGVLQKQAVALADMSWDVDLPATHEDMLESVEAIQQAIGKVADVIPRLTFNPSFFAEEENEEEKAEDPSSSREKSE